MDGYGIRGLFMYSKYGLSFGWLVGFYFLFRHGYISYYSKVVVVAVIFSSIFLFSPCYQSLFLDLVCMYLACGVRIALSVLDSFFASVLQK